MAQGDLNYIFDHALDCMGLLSQPQPDSHVVEKL
jgi:hypothetical protein